MPIKVTHVVRQYHPSVGGMEEVVQNIARQQLTRYGHAPTILTLDRLFRNSHERLATRELIDGIPVIRLPYHGSSRYPLCPSVLEHVRDADVIHVHGIDFFLRLSRRDPADSRPAYAGFYARGLFPYALRVEVEKNIFQYRHALIRPRL